MVTYINNVIDGRRHQGHCARLLLGQNCTCFAPFPIPWPDVPAASPSAGSSEQQALNDAASLSQQYIARIRGDK